MCLSTRYSKYNYTFEYAGDEDDPITVTYDLKIRYNSITKKYVIGGKIFLEGYQFQVDGAASDNVTFKVKKITMSPIRGSEYARYVTFYLNRDYTDSIQIDLPAECFLKAGHSPLYLPEYPDVPPLSGIFIYSMKNSKFNPHTFFTDVIIRTSFT